VKTEHFECKGVQYVQEKKNEVLEKKYQGVLDLNMREYEEAQQEVDDENQKPEGASHVPRALSGLMHISFV
jgi:hypothetical protein